MTKCSHCTVQHNRNVYCNFRRLFVLDLTALSAQNSYMISCLQKVCRQAGVQGGVQRSAGQHRDVTREPHQDATAASVRRHPSHMAHCAVTAAQPTECYLRRLGMRGPRRQVQFVLRQQGETHPGQHRGGATAVQPPGVRFTTAYRTKSIQCCISQRSKTAKIKCYKL